MNTSNNSILDATLKAISTDLNIDLESLVELSKFVYSNVGSDISESTMDENSNNGRSNNEGLVHQKEIDTATSILNIISHLASGNSIDQTYFNQLRHEISLKESPSKETQINSSESSTTNEIDSISNEHKTESNLTDYLSANQPRQSNLTDCSTANQPSLHQSLSFCNYNNSSKINKNNIEPVLLNKKRIFKVYYQQISVAKAINKDDKKSIIHKKFVFSNKELIKSNFDEIKKEIIKNNHSSKGIEEQTNSSDEKSQVEIVKRERKGLNLFSRNSKYRGVSRNGNRWQVLIMVSRKKRYVGTYATEDEAGRGYDIAALQNHGMKSKTNFSYSLDEIKQILSKPPILKLKLDLFTKNRNCFLN